MDLLNVGENQPVDKETRIPGPVGCCTWWGDGHVVEMGQFKDCCLLFEGYRKPLEACHGGVAHSS